MIVGNLSLLDTLRKYAVYIYIALLPWQARYIITQGILNGYEWEFATVSVYVIDVFVFFAAFATLLIAQRTKRIVNRKNIILLAFGFFYGFIILSLGTFPKTALTGAYIILLFVACAIVFFLTPFNKRMALFMLVFAGLWSGLLGMYQFFIGTVSASTWLGIAEQNVMQPGVSVLLVDGIRLLRAYGSMPHPNMLGGLLAISIVSNLVAILVTQVKNVRLLLLIILAIQAFSFGLTFSRSAFIGLVVGTCIICLSILWSSTSLRKRFIINILVLLISLAAFGYIFSDELQSRVFTDSRIEKISLNERSSEFEAYKPLAKKYWLWGTGINTYSEALASADNYKRPAWAYPPVHNAYFLLFIQVGILGLGIAGMALYQWFMEQKKNFNSIQLAYFAPLAVFAIIALFDHYPISHHFGIGMSIILFAITKQD